MSCGRRVRVWRLICRNRGSSSCKEGQCDIDSKRREWHQMVILKRIGLRRAHTDCLPVEAVSTYVLHLLSA